MWQAHHHPRLPQAHRRWRLTQALRPPLTQARWPLRCQVRQLWLTSGTVHPVPSFRPGVLCHVPGDMLLCLLIHPVLSCLVHGDSSGGGGSSGYGHGGHSQPPGSPVVEKEAVAEGFCEGPRLDLSIQAEPKEGFLFLWDVLFLCLALEGSWYSLNYPMAFWGG